MMQKLIILHETDGRPYFKALEALEREGLFEIEYRESSVVRLTLSQIYKREWNKLSAKRILGNILFRFRAPFLAGNIIILAMAPYDIRIAWYGRLGRKNKVIEHTSWPYWGTAHIPRRYSVFTGVGKAVWARFFRNDCYRIVCVLQQTKESIQSAFYPKGAIFVIPHAVGLPQVCRDRPSTRDRLRLLFVGKLIREKGLELLNQLGIWATDAGFDLSIVGDGKDRHLLRRCIQNGVNWHGQIRDPERLAAIYAQHDILLVPSKKTNRWEELFGIVLIEGMACGLVVLSSDHVGPRNIVQHGITGFLLKEDDLEAWQAQLIALSRNRGLMSDISNGARTAARKYDISRVAERWRNALSGRSLDE
jgi:glycosyltransferase involved in cell wall biosynthesis